MATKYSSKLVLAAVRCEELAQSLVEMDVEHVIEMEYVKEDTGQVVMRTEKLSSIFERIGKMIRQGIDELPEEVRDA